jgi:hypothetical protein
MKTRHSTDTTAASKGGTSRNDTHDDGVEVNSRRQPQKSPRRRSGTNKRKRNDGVAPASKTRRKSTRRKSAATLLEETCAVAIEELGGGLVDASIASSAEESANEGDEKDHACVAATESKGENEVTKPNECYLALALAALDEPTSSNEPHAGSTSQQCSSSPSPSQHKSASPAPPSSPTPPQSPPPKPSSTLAAPPSPPKPSTPPQAAPPSPPKPSTPPQAAPPSPPKPSTPPQASQAASSGDLDQVSQRVLGELQSRLVWSRMTELKDLQRKLADVHTALHHVEESVERDINATARIIEHYLPDAQETEYSCVFSKFLRDIVAYFAM